MISIKRPIGGCRSHMDVCVNQNLTPDGTGSGGGNKRLRMLTNSSLQRSGCAATAPVPGDAALKIRPLWALSMSSGWCAATVRKGGGKKTFSAAPLAHAPAWLRYCGNQANSWLCVCCDNGERFPGSQRCSAVFAEINPASWVVPDSRVCLCQLSAMPLRPPLSAARRSVPCFSSSFCTDGWHSCSAGPRGLLKKAINQSRHSIQAGNWPIRVAQDAYVRSGIFTNWLSIYTKLGDSTRKIHLFTCHNRRITALPQAADAASQRSEALLLNHTSFIQHTRHVYDSQCCY